VRVVVTDIAPEVGTRCLAGEQHFGVDAVLVLLLDALLGRSGTRRGGVVLAPRLPDIAALAAVQVEWHLAQRSTFDEPRVATIRQVNNPRRLVAIHGWDSVNPPLRVDLHMRIRGDVAICASHVVAGSL